VTRPARSLEDIEARVARRERRLLVWTVALSIVFFVAAATLLILAIGGVRRTESELDDAQTHLLAVLRHDLQVASASFHPDGHYVLTASADGAARVWDWEARSVVAKLRQPGCPTCPMTDASFSPDGRLVVTAGEAGDAVVVEWGSKRVLTTLRHDHPLMRAEFNSDGRLLVTAGGREARVWDWRAGRVVAVIAHSGQVLSAAFGPGDLVVTGSDERAHVWDLRAPRRPVVELPPPARNGSDVPTFDAVFGQSGVVLAASNGAATIYDRVGALRSQYIHAGDVTSAVFSPDESLVLTTSSAGAALLWPRGGNAPPVVLRQDDASSLLDAGFSPSGQLVVTASSDARAEVFRPARKALAGERDE
jgi:WD40 repeat protein